jgi:hypothetical protein
VLLYSTVNLLLRCFESERAHLATMILIHYQNTGIDRALC